jgi:uncharacterized protein DUF4416
MGTPVEPKPTKYFVAFLVSDLSLLASVEEELLATLGEIDVRGTITAWQMSKFYQAEMGANLWRGFWSLQSLGDPEGLVAAKLQTQAIEDLFHDPVSGGRRVNLDPGYLDRLKVVLASTKNANQRIYLNSGIYAEAALFYHHGAFHGLTYTYPDYLTPQASDFLKRVRAIYVEQLRHLDVRTAIQQ